MDINIALGEHHTYQRDDRKAKVFYTKKGWSVNLYLRYGDKTNNNESWTKVQTRECFEHSERWAEDVAENFVDGLYNVRA